MPHYKDQNNQIHFLDSIEYKHLLPLGSVRMTAGETEAIRLASIPAKTPEQIIAELEAAVRSFMDGKAAERGYDDIKSATIRAGYPGPFHDEGVAYATWMDACWAHCYQALAAVQSGSRTIPTAIELIADLPVLVLP